MGRSLVAAAGQIKISHAIGREDAQTVAAFRGKIDVPVSRQRRGGDEKDMLRADKFLQVIADALVQLAHENSL